jgi:proteic killer suppression protein
MIISFSSKKLEEYYYEDQRKLINSDHREKLARILDRLNQASDIKDMNYPGSDLHKLEPKKDNRWAVKVSGNWRVTFIFDDGNASEVDYEDYH